MAEKGSGLSEAINKITRVEQDLDEVAEFVERSRRELITLAERESSKLREEVVKELMEEHRRILEKERERAEEEARRIIEKGEEEAKELRRVIQEKFEEAVRMTINRLLGGG